MSQNINMISGDVSVKMTKKDMKSFCNNCNVIGITKKSAFI